MKNAHSIGKKEELDGLQGRWRDARILTENLEENRREVSDHATEFSFLKNELTVSTSVCPFIVIISNIST